jgi:hypothetical protein
MVVGNVDDITRRELAELETVEVWARQLTALPKPVRRLPPPNVLAVLANA